MVKVLSRSDADILQDVHRELQWDTRIRSAGINVEVDRGIVTLTGTVGSYPEKDAAEEAAHRVRGVQDVANDMNVRLAGVHAHAVTDDPEKHYIDKDIAAELREALSEDPMLATEHIESTVSHGAVKLTGQVKSWEQQVEAAFDVRRIPGVCDVTNNIIVRAAPLSLDEVRSAIKKALEQQAGLTAANIDIVVDNDGAVTLTGSVQSYEERRVVLEATQKVPGVSSVDDQLRIESPG